MVVRALRTETAQEVAIKTFQRVKIEAKDKAARGEHAQRAPRPQAAAAERPPGDRQRDRGARGGEDAHVALEYCAGGSLGRQLQKSSCKGLAERVAATVIGQVASALRHLHAAGRAAPRRQAGECRCTSTARARASSCATLASPSSAAATAASRAACAARLSTWRPRFGAPIPAAPTRARPSTCGRSAPWRTRRCGHAAFRGSSMEQLKMRVLRADHVARLRCRRCRRGRAPSSPHSSCPTPPRAPPPPPRSTTRSSPPTLASTYPSCRRSGSNVAAVVAASHRSAAAPEAPAPARASRVAAAGHRRVGVRDRVAGQRDGTGAGEAVESWPTAPPSPAEYSICVPSTGYVFKCAVTGAYFRSLRHRRVAHAKRPEAVVAVGAEHLARAVGSTIEERLRVRLRRDDAGQIVRRGLGQAELQVDVRPAAILVRRAASRRAPRRP